MPIESKAIQKSSAPHVDRVLVGHVGQKSPDVQDLDRAMTKGALWMILARLGDRSLGFVSTLILVRLLTPADFGLVAMAMSVIAVCELFGQVGFDIALIQNPRATRSHYDTAWTFSVILAALTSITLMLLAVPAANFYGEARLASIIQALAVGSFISGFENVGVVAFRKDLHFSKEFNFIFSKKLIGFLVTTSLAIALRNYWALIGGIIVSRLAAVVLSYYVQEYRPRWSLEARRDLFQFSKWLVISNLGNVLNGRSADFIVGKIAGAHALGVFNLSYELSNLPTSELVAPINRAVYPGYARKSEDNAVLKKGCLDVFGMIAAFGVPAAVGIAATSDWLVPLALGHQWDEAIPLVAVLAFYGILAAMKSNSHYVYLALGRPHIATYLGIAQISLLLPALIVLIKTYGVLGAAYAYLLSQAVFTPISFSVLFKVLGVSAREIIRLLWRPALSAVFMFAIVRLLASALPIEPHDNLTMLQNFLAMVGCGAVVYASCLYFLWSLLARPVGAETQILGAVQSTRFWSWLKA